MGAAELPMGSREPSEPRRDHGGPATNKLSWEILSITHMRKVWQRSDLSRPTEAAAAPKEERQDRVFCLVSLSDPYIANMETASISFTIKLKLV